MGDYNWFRVNSEDNYYHDMVGRCVADTEKTLILEFPFSKELGGTQRVQFFREQLEFDGAY